jgi:GAF domain-containing protein
VIRPVLEDLLERTGASRVTLRHGEGFPVVEEVLAPGVHSIAAETTLDLRTQPVAVEVASGRQVVHDDSASAYDDPEYQRMRTLYGGLAAQIVTPVFAGGEVVAIVSLHQLGEPRHWTEDEVEACWAAAARVAELL